VHLLRSFNVFISILFFMLTICSTSHIFQPNEFSLVGMVRSGEKEHVWLTTKLKPCSLILSREYHEASPFLILHRLGLGTLARLQELQNAMGINREVS
jgi:hypothetical protein